jgi:hypothetical protein
VDEITLSLDILTRRYRESRDWRDVTSQELARVRQPDTQKLHAIQEQRAKLDAEEREIKDRMMKRSERELNYYRQAALRVEQFAKFPILVDIAHDISLLEEYIQSGVNLTIKGRYLVDIPGRRAVRVYLQKRKDLLVYCEIDSSYYGSLGSCIGTTGQEALQGAWEMMVVSYRRELDELLRKTEKGLV